MTNIEVCFNCQRMMTEAKLDPPEEDDTGMDGMLLAPGETKDIKATLWLCRYCGFINYKLPTEFTAFTVFWNDADKVKDVDNIPVMYWEPPESEKKEEESDGGTGGGVLTAPLEDESTKEES